MDDAKLKELQLYCDLTVTPNSECSRRLSATKILGFFTSELGFPQIANSFHRVTDCRRQKS
uniref:Transposase n=1 Tax=Romanomermis culicivorax TaxID=13658 RepID=A0A915HW64_ROMCU